MHLRRSLVALGAVAAALAAAASAYSAHARHVDQVDAAAPQRFVVRATAAGLYPGSSKPLLVLVQNPNARAIRVVALTVAARDASAACGAENLLMPGFRGAFVVPARGSRYVGLRIGMRRIAPDACQGASFQLVFAGRAVGL